MDNHWTECCIICDAPLQTFEYDGHLKGCLLIEAKRTGKTDAEIMTELRELAPATAERPVPHSGRGGWPDSMWNRGETNDHGHPLQAVLPGHVRCAVCGGNKTLYPNCAACDGTGSVGPHDYGC